jgi:hypothetical protein
MLPVCNQRPAVVELLDRLRLEPEPASGLRLVRLHGRGRGRPEELKNRPEWPRAQEWLQRCAAAPALKLDSGR